MSSSIAFKCDIEATRSSDIADRCTPHPTKKGRNLAPTTTWVGYYYSFTLAGNLRSLFRFGDNTSRKVNPKFHHKREVQ